MTLKKHILIFIFLLPFIGKAQLYSFIESNVSYSPEAVIDTLWGKTSWQANASSDTTVDVNLSKYLNFYTKKIHQVSIQKNGSILLFSRKFPTNTVWGAYNTYRSINSGSNFSIIGMHFQGQSTDTSSLVIEYRNIGFVGKNDSEYVNFKIILHYDTDSIDIIYGKSFTNASSWSAAGGVLVGLDTGISKEVIQFLSGNPDSPSMINNNINSRLNSFPKEGTKYTFFPFKNIAINDIDISQQIFIYPNPAFGSCTIHRNSLQKEELCIYNTLGVLIYKDCLLQGHTQKSIDMVTLPQGIYIIKLGDAVRKVIKE